MPLPPVGRGNILGAWGQDRKNAISRVWFRVAAVNANGQSPWSDPATKIVP